MGQITGQSGRFALNDSHILFGEWNIHENKVGPNKPGQSGWFGSFEIHKPDSFKIIVLVGEQMDADFYGNENYCGEIMIDSASYSPLDDPTVVYFTVTDELKKSSHRCW